VDGEARADSLTTELWIALAIVTGFGFVLALVAVLVLRAERKPVNISSKGEGNGTVLAVLSEPAMDEAPREFAFDGHTYLIPQAGTGCVRYRPGISRCVLDAWDAGGMTKVDRALAELHKVLHGDPAAELLPILRDLVSRF